MSAEPDFTLAEEESMEEALRSYKLNERLKKEHEAHSSDCNYWCNEDCNCAMRFI